MRIMTPALKRGTKEAISRILELVSVSPSQHKFAKPEAAATERKPRVQADDKHPSASTPVLLSPLPPTTIKVYAQVIPELASLLDHMERKSPILVISTMDASMDSFLPFQLPSEYGCVVLGFFDVESVEVSSAFPTTLRFSCLSLTSARVRIPLLPRAFNLGNFRGGCNYVMHLHWM